MIQQDDICGHCCCHAYICFRLIELIPGLLFQFTKCTRILRRINKTEPYYYEQIIVQRMVAIMYYDMLCGVSYGVEHYVML